MLSPVYNWIRTLNDPFRNARTASRWIASLPAIDALSIQKEAQDLVASFPGARNEVRPGQVEALLKVDARLEPVIAQLTQQYTANYQKSTSVESRLRSPVYASRSWDADTVSRMKSKLVSCERTAFASVERTTSSAPRRFASAAFHGDLVNSTVCAPNARASFTPMCPSPPSPTMPTFFPVVTPQCLSGE